MPRGSVDGGHTLPTGEDILANGIILKGKYEIQRLIHSGGMGYIYAAMDIRLRRQVVIKQVREQVKSGQHKERLEQEALSMARLSHPNVAMVLDHFTENNYYFLVIEFVAGKTLSEIFEERSQQLTEAEVVRWMLPVCEAVDYIHSQGFVHRDISPDNIMLTPEGRIKLIDFGTLYELSSIAGRKAGKEGKFGFTPPEQWKGQPMPQSDDFSIGATIYYLLTGFLSVSEECRSGGKPQPSDYSPEFPPIRSMNPQVSSNLQATLQRVLQAEPSERYEGVYELRQVLDGQVREATTSTAQTQPGISTAGTPEIRLDRTDLNFGNVAPGTRPSKTFQVGNFGTGTLMGKISTIEPWIKVSPQIIDLTNSWQSITVSVDVSFLLLEKQTTGYIDIESNAGSARVEVKVTASNKAQSGFKAWMLAPGIIGILAIIGIANSPVCHPLAPPKMQVSTMSMGFNNLKPDSNSVPDKRSISNSGELPLRGTVESDALWLKISPSEININPDQTIDLKISVNTDGMAFGQQKTGTITIDTNGGKATIPVNLSITKVIFQDDFSDPDSGWDWGELSTQDYDMGYKQGGYSIKVKKPGWRFNEYCIKLADLGDFVAEVDVKWLTSGSPSSGCYYLYFRMDDAENTYRYGVNTQDGSYFIGKSVQSTDAILKEWTVSPAINEGTAVNRMKVVCQGTMLKFYMNDILLTSLTDYSLAKGKIALSAGRFANTYSDIEALFDNFKVSVP